jgi:hypothetical protein
MAQYYATPTYNDTSGMYEFLGWINRSPSEGLFFPVLLLVIWIISFLAMKGYSSARAWTFASFFCAVLAMIMAVLDYINPKFMYLCIFLTLIGFIWLKLEDA